MSVLGLAILLGAVLALRALSLALNTTGLQWVKGANRKGTLPRGDEL